jgi:HEAT repeat protein
MRPGWHDIMGRSPLIQKLRSACIASGLALAVALTVGGYSSFLRAAEPDAQRTLDDAALRRRLLDALLAEPDLHGQRASQLLRYHGPILAEEIDYLMSKAGSGAKTVRRNATHLLTLARPPEERDIPLRHLVATSDDPGVVVIALASLLDSREEVPLAWALAAQRREAIIEALREGGAIAAAALEPAFRLNLPGAADEMRKQLADPSWDVRREATYVLAKEGAGALEADVIAILLDPERRRSFQHIVGRLYQALTYSDNPSTASVLRQSLVGSTRDEQTDFSNALLLSHSRKPWLRAFLLDLATHDGDLQWVALDRLGRWGAEAPTRELVQVCAAELQHHVDAEPAKLIFAEGVETCRRFVGELAGRDFWMTKLREASDFASRWLTAH